jgi:hypothetical protein
MKFLNKLFINTGLFSVLTLLLLVPVLAVTMAGFNTRSVESSEVLSAQDENINTREERYDGVPVELEEIIRKVELEMAKEAAANQEAARNSMPVVSSPTEVLEIGN